MSGPPPTVSVHVAFGRQRVVVFMNDSDFTEPGTDSLLLLRERVGASLGIPAAFLKLFSVIRLEPSGSASTPATAKVALGTAHDVFNHVFRTSTIDSGNGAPLRYSEIEASLVAPANMIPSTEEYMRTLAARRDVLASMLSELEAGHASPSPAVAPLTNPDAIVRKVASERIASNVRVSVAEAQVRAEESAQLAREITSRVLVAMPHLGNVRQPQQPSGARFYA